MEEQRFGERVAQRALVLERGAREIDEARLGAAQGVVRRQRLTVLLHELRSAGQPREPRIEIRERPALHAQRMEVADHGGGKFVRRRLNEGLQEELVRALVEIRDGGDRLERLLVEALHAVQPRRDVFQAQLVELDLVVRAAPPSTARSRISMP